MADIPSSAITAIVGLLAILGAFAVQRHVAFRAAAVKFRSALLSELAGLYPHPSQWPQDIDRVLRQAFPKLQAAVAEFNLALPKRKRAGFLAAWHAFHCSTGRPVDAQVYHQYMAFSSNPDPKATFRANVERLLSYAGEA